MNIYPNPAKDLVFISFPGIINNRDKEIILYNSIGIPVKSIFVSGNYSGTTADISELPAGLYFMVLIVNGNKMGKGKLIVTY